MKVELELQSLKDKALKEIDMNKAKIFGTGALVNRHISEELERIILKNNESKIYLSVPFGTPVAPCITYWCWEVFSVVNGAKTYIKKGS